MINFEEIGLIALRSILAIMILLLTTKMLGKKQLSQLTIYDYVVGITIGSIAADAIITLDEHFINGMLAILIFGLIAYGLSIISIKSENINELLNGKPTVLMEKGIFNFENLRKTKIPIYKFIEQARLKGYYDLFVLNYAVLETNGEISFLPKEQYQPTAPLDFKTEVKKKTKQTFCEYLIIDDKINYSKLEELGKDEEWLKKELEKNNIHKIEKILVATIDENKKIRIYKELI